MDDQNDVVVPGEEQDLPVIDAPAEVEGAPEEEATPAGEEVAG